MGKLSSKNLEKLLVCIKKNPKVIVPPLPGFDSGVHLVDDKYLVISTDPCINVPETWFGWLLIHYAASDVALFGAEPEFCTLNLLGPPRTKPQVFSKIMKQTCRATDELQMSIVTGHTGTYENLSVLVGVCTAYGIVDKDKLITPDGARAGDAILCVKRLGLETIVNFASAREAAAYKLFGHRQTKKLTKLVCMQSCVKEALLLAKIRGVHAMHDATEGGLTAALNEMAEASRIGFEIHSEKLPMGTEVAALQEKFRLSDRQVLSMSSTGTILAAVSPEAKSEVEDVLRQNSIDANVIGHFVAGHDRFLFKGARRQSFPMNADDPYEMILSANA